MPEHTPISPIAPPPDQPRAFLRALFECAVAAAGAQVCLPPHLPPRPAGRTRVIGAGKAAAAMARAVETAWDGPLSGLVVTRYGHGLPCERIEVIEAAHPVPDAAGRMAAERMLAAVQGLGPDDLVLCLLSGGGSALMALPAPGIAFEHKQELNRALLRSGAAIAEINCVRKHLSAIKGGRLALACAPARLATLLISDVPGDDPAIVASGPTLPDESSCDDALAVLAKYAVAVPPAVRHWLASGAGETPKPGDPRFAGNSWRIVADAGSALGAAARMARAAGVQVQLLGDDLQGEARALGAQHAALALRLLAQGAPRPCLLLSGGETSVTLRGHGRGGRNAEYLLSLSIALQGQAGVHAIACDTDGIDGSEDNAGALCGPDTLARAAARGLAAQAMLDDNDAYRFFAALDELVVSGPTRTNVNDFRAILIA